MSFLSLQITSSLDLYHPSFLIPQFSSMAPPFHLRKFLSTDDESPPSCYICSTCDPDECFTPPPLTVSHHRIPLFLIIMLSVLAFAILLISYLALTRYRNRPTTTRRRIMHPGAASSTSLAESEVAFREADDEEEVEPQEEDQGTPAVDHHVWYIRTVGFPQSVIDSITVFRYKSGEGLIEGTDCSVCLNEFEEDETLRLLPKCSHAFHLPCIDTWLRAHKNCPVCRAPILVLNDVPGSSVDGNMPDFGNQAENDSDTRQEIGTQESGEIRAGGPGNVPTMPIQEDAVKIRRGTNPGHGDFRVLSDLSHHRVKIDQESQPVRRSASLDLSSTSMAIKEGRLDKQGHKNSGIVKLIKSASFGRSLQKGPVSMKRSISLNGKRLLWKNNSRRQKSIYLNA